MKTTIRFSSKGADQYFDNPGTFSIDELAVWYGAVNISTITFIYNYQGEPQPV